MWVAPRGRVSSDLWSAGGCIDGGALALGGMAFELGRSNWCVRILMPMKPPMDHETVSAGYRVRRGNTQHAAVTLRTSHCGAEAPPRRATSTTRAAATQPHPPGAALSPPPRTARGAAPSPAAAPHKPDPPRPGQRPWRPAASPRPPAPPAAPPAPRPVPPPQTPAGPPPPSRERPPRGTAGRGPWRGRAPRAPRARSRPVSGCARVGADDELASSPRFASLPLQASQRASHAGCVHVRVRACWHT